MHPGAGPEVKSLESEQQAVRMERLNLIGEAAASIGHEMRNPLTTARGFLQLIGESAEGQPLRDYFNIIINELDCANSILSDFLLLSKNKSVEFNLQDLNSIIQDNHPELQAEAEKDHKSVFIKLGSIPSLMLDKKEILKLIMNLTLNGIEAMKPGGIITISTRTEGDQVVLSVKDTGKGIPPHLHDILGTPFLTTKESGIGLGLAVCYSIAARHNATLAFITGDQGTTFNLRFPAD
ncbi:MAG: hypothetical protein GXY50_11090 [Syntrophomonadaceae bacterium]|nr:hypothetical protein [Syntrophomonadaceae bacterium]